MEIVAKDDLRNRIPPRVYDFHARFRKSDDEEQTKDGVVSWYKFHYKKDYCQSQIGYTCQRPAASVSGSDGTGIVHLNMLLLYDVVCILLTNVL